MQAPPFLSKENHLLIWSKKDYGPLLYLKQKKVEEKRRRWVWILSHSANKHELYNYTNTLILQIF